MTYVRSLLESWFKVVATARGRRVLIAVICVDAPFAFVFLVALQTYFRPQHLAGSAVPGLCLALFGAGKLFAQYFAGRATDRLGPGLTLRVGLGVIAACLATLLVAPSVHLLVLPASAAYGVGSAIVWPAIFGQANAFPPGQRSQITAAMTVTTGLSLGLALGLGMVLPESFSFRLAVLGALVVVGAALLQSTRRPEATPQPAEERSLPTRSPALRDLLADAAYVRLGVVFLLQSMALAALLSVFRAVGSDLLEVSLRDEMLLLLPAGAAFGLGIGLAALAGQVEGRRQLLSAAFLIGGAGFLAATQADGTAWITGLLAVGYFGLGLAVPTTTAASLDIARSTPGLLFGFLLTLEGLGQALGPALSAALSDVRGVLGLAGGALIVACIVALIPAGLSVREPIAEVPQEV